MMMMMIDDDDDACADADGDDGDGDDGYCDPDGDGGRADYRRGAAGGGRHEGHPDADGRVPRGGRDPHGAARGRAEQDRPSGRGGEGRGPAEAPGPPGAHLRADAVPE